MSAHVAILLATYNGERHLEAQLASLLAQTHHDWSLHVSDDGSSDSSLAIIEAFAENIGEERVRIYHGPGKGFVRNFLSLACNADIEADYFAFCDQDDLWFETKLEVALAALSASPLSASPADGPAVYVSRTETFADGVVTGASPLFTRRPSLQNALVQSIGGGNTMVFNRAARNLLQSAGEAIDVPAHDWWTYLVVASCDGDVIYDPTPSLKYRQHEKNIIGENSSWAARMSRVHSMLRGRNCQWNAANLDALERLAPLMPKHNAKLIEGFRDMRLNDSMIARVKGIQKLGIYRQTRWGTISLYGAAMLGKL